MCQIYNNNKNDRLDESKWWMKHFHIFIYNQTERVIYVEKLEEEVEDEFE